jgi:hypothetical protein
MSARVLAEISLAICTKRAGDKSLPAYHNFQKRLEAEQRLTSSSGISKSTSPITGVVAERCQNLPFDVGKPPLQREGKLTTEHVVADHFVLYPLPINLPGDRSKQ